MSSAAPINVGAWFDLRNPPPWRRSGADLYAATLGFCEQAERLGLHSVWFSEHHRFEDGYLPQPLTMAAAVAARTHKVRIGTAALLAPLRSTADLAEQAAIVDLISAGRLDLGLGAGYRLPEFELFDRPMKERFRALDAAVPELRRLWREGVITPAPAQDDLPIWFGLHSEKGARRTGRAGERLLSGNPSVWPAYRDGLLEGGHDLSRAMMSGAVIGFVSEDPERDWRTIPQHLAYQWNTYRRYGVEGLGVEEPPSVDPQQLRANGLSNRSGDGFFLGTPEEWADELRDHYAGIPVQTVFFVASVAGMPDEMVVEHLRALARLQDLVGAPSSALTAS